MGPPTSSRRGWSPPLCICSLAPLLLSHPQEIGAGPTPRPGTPLGTNAPQIFAKAEVDAVSREAPEVSRSLSDLSSKSTDFTQKSTPSTSFLQRRASTGLSEPLFLAGVEGTCHICWPQSPPSPSASLGALHTRGEHLDFDPGDATCVGLWNQVWQCPAGSVEVSDFLTSVCLSFPSVEGGG